MILKWEQLQEKLENNAVVRMTSEEVSCKYVITAGGNQYLEKKLLITTDDIKFYLEVTYSDDKVLNSFILEPSYEMKIKYLNKQATIDLLNKVA